MVSLRIIVLTILLFGTVVIAQDRLDPWVRGLNEKYFNSELPATIVVSHNLHDDRFQALTDTTTEHGVVYYHLMFNPKYNISTKTEQLNLFHELCHVRQMINNEVDSLDDHGPHWQSCMLELAKKGAFRDLW